MGHKIFISYKFADSNVQPLFPYNSGWLVSQNTTTVRDYVTKIQERLAPTNHINKGEPDGVDLSRLSDATIWEKLKNRIYDSSITIVLISPNMRETWRSDRDQWIPWEISYSLKEASRTSQTGMRVTSHANAILAVVLPDRNGSYAYYRKDNLFYILRQNMDNKRGIPYASYGTYGRSYNTAYGVASYNEQSYIETIQWNSFIADMNYYIEKAYKRAERINDFEITYNVEPPKFW